MNYKRENNDDNPDINDKKENIHANHRKRMRDKYIESGLDVFSDHEIVEMLFYYTFAQQNTNDIAHKLLENAGGFANLLEADVHTLINKYKVNERAAILFSMFLPVYKRYLKKKMVDSPKIVSSYTAGVAAMQLFIGETSECVYLMCLNNQRNLIKAELIAKGQPNETTIAARKVVDVALKYNAVFVILAHNHPGGLLAPSKEDIKATEEIIKILRPLNIELSDHIIVALNGYYSFSEKKLMGLTFIT